jgi:transposase
MRKSREILRLKWVAGRTHREVAQSLSVSVGAVAVTVGRALGAGLDWAATEKLSEQALEERLYGSQTAASSEDRPRPDCAYLHAERKRPGVTLELLHQEYLEQHPGGGYGYTQFCEYYRRWLKQRRLSMRQVHRAGDKLFIDYSGDTLPIIDAASGEIRRAELFIAVLGASNYTFAEANWTQQLPDWIPALLGALRLVYPAACLIPGQIA